MKTNVCEFHATNTMYLNILFLFIRRYTLTARLLNVHELTSTNTLPPSPLLSSPLDPLPPSSLASLPISKLSSTAVLAERGGKRDGDSIFACPDESSSSLGSGSRRRLSAQHGRMSGSSGEGRQHIPWGTSAATVGICDIFDATHVDGGCGRISRQR